MLKNLLRTRYTSPIHLLVAVALVSLFLANAPTFAQESQPASQPADKPAQEASEPAKAPTASVAEKQTMPAIIEAETINIAKLAARAATEGSPQIQRVTGQPFPTFAIWSDETEVIWRDMNDDATKQQIIEAVTMKLNDYISTAATQKSPFPAGTKIEKIWIERLMLRIDLHIPKDDLAGVPIAPAQTIDKDTSFNDQVDWLAGEDRPAAPDWLEGAAALGLEMFMEQSHLRSLKILAAPPEEEKKNFDENDPDFDPYDETSAPDYREIAFYHRFQPPIAWKPFDLTGDYGTTPEIPTDDPRYRTQPTGALTGATIFLSPGHGWLYNDRNNQWNTQRGPSHGVVEDLSNAEWVLQYLVPYLWNAGATVVTMRERNLNPNMVILDNASDDESRGSVAMEGEWRAQDIGGSYNGTHVVTEAVEGRPEDATASILYTPNIPAPGDYAVYVWYRRPLASEEGAEEPHPAAQSAQYVINHAGGQSVWVQNQLRDGFTWKYIGTYYFEAGQNPDTGSLRIPNATLDGEGFVVADAVRFGGGMGDYIPPAPETEEGAANEIAVDIPTASGYPRWEESGFYYSDFMGYKHAEEDFRGFNSVAAMPTHAEWEAERWEVENSLYFAWHTNASAGGKSRGLSSFVYGSEGWGPLSWFVGFPGGRDLQGWTHREVLSDVRADWERSWRDVKRITRWLGETNPNRNKKMPMDLIEVGFHDNPNDTLMILNPSFRRLTARAAYQGIVKYYNSSVPGFDHATLLPEPPDHFSAVVEDGTVKLSWAAPPYDGLDDKKYGKGVLGDEATGYVIYHSTNGKGFDNGTSTGEATTFSVDSLEAGKVHYFKVAAINNGGESLPTEVLAVRVAEEADAPRILLVTSFDRFDKGLNTTVEYKESGRTFERGIISLLNSRDYLIQHAEAVAAAGDYAIDSTSDEAVANVSVNLEKYDAVIYQFGRESTGGVLSEGEKLALHLYLVQGGALFMSGGDIAWALDAQNTGRAFHRLLLRAEYAGDESTSFAVTGVRGTVFADIGEITLEDGEGLAPEVYDPEQGAYIAAGSDFLKVVEGSHPALRYVVDEENAAYDFVAALQYEGAYRLIYLAFPFETIQGAETRNSVMNQGLEYLLSIK